MINSRRSFVKNIVQTAALSTLASSAINNFQSIIRPGEKSPKRIRIGIIGAENSHTIGFGKLFNIDKTFENVSVDFVWGETAEFALAAMKKGNIPQQVSDPLKMIGKIDALIVDHRHGKYHLDAALPFIEEGIPSFIDKPFCYRLEEGRKFLDRALQLGTPVTSYSSIAHSYDTENIKEQLGQFNKINQVTVHGPLDIYSKYGGVFFYGPHLIEPIIYLFEDKIEKVRVTKNDTAGSASLIFENGMMITLVFAPNRKGWQTFIESEEGLVELKSKLHPATPSKNYVDMVEMFRSGKKPRSYESILTGIAILEALEKSVHSDNWEKVETI